MLLKLIDPDTEERIDMPLKEGDVFMIPPNVPHRPVRKANTVGLVVEYWRPEGKNDQFVWYCDECDTQGQGISAAVLPELEGSFDINQRCDGNNDDAGENSIWNVKEQRSQKQN